MTQDLQLRAVDGDEPRIRVKNQEEATGCCASAHVDAHAKPNVAVAGYDANVWGAASQLDRFVLRAIIDDDYLRVR